MEKEKKQNTVNINGKEITMKPGTQAIIICEEITGKPFELKTNKDVMAYIYASMMAGTPDLELDFRDLLDALDDTELLRQCINIITKRTSIQKVAQLSSENEGGSESKKD